MTESVVRWHISFRGGPLDGVLLPVEDDHDVCVDDPALVQDLVATVLAESDEPSDRIDAYRWSGLKVTASPGHEVIVMVLGDEPGPEEALSE